MTEIKGENVLSWEILNFFFAGVLTILLDLIVLNILVLTFGAGQSGGLYTAFKTISFFVSLIASFFLNKYCVFVGQKRQKELMEKVLFFIVSLIGFAFNVVISSLVFDALQSFQVTHLGIATTISALVGTAAVLVWNFLGYKFVVFTALY